MAEIGTSFLQEEPQLFARSLGELLALFARRAFPRDTAKHIARRWNLDRTTAENALRGHGSERTVTKAIKAEGWPLVMALGEALTGQTYQQHLARMVEEAANVARLHAEHRAAVAELEDRAVRAGLVDRSRLRGVR